MAADEPALGAQRQEPTCRLFFALWPDQAMRAAMVRATRKAALAAGRPVPAANLHVTLAFLGSIPGRRLGELGEVARASAALPEGRLELALDHLEYWRPARLLCALPTERPEAIAALARRLQDELVARGFVPDRKRSRSVEIDITSPFRPHVTLARKVYRSPRTIEMQPVTWSFTDFVLVDSRTLPEGPVYTVLEKFPSISESSPIFVPLNLTTM